LVFEQEEKEGLFEAIKGLKEPVSETSALLELKKERQFEREHELLDVTWMESMENNELILHFDEEEANIAVFMAACAGGAGDVAAGDDASGGDGDGRAGQSAFDFGFNFGTDFSSGSSFVFWSAATSGAAGASVESVAPDLHFTGVPVSAGKVERNCSNESTSGKSTPMSVSGSVVMFDASAAGTTKSGQSTRRRKPKK